jgi:flagellar basal-body rod modification protein FlgD
MVTAGIGKDGLGRDAFLQLLTTQMQNQNPLQPQADGEFLAQLAQFSSLEQLQAIREDMTSLIVLVKSQLPDIQIPTTSNSGDI